MCGIAGFVGKKSLDDSVLDAMQRSFDHRGPDGHGMWSDASRRVSLLHRRLAILDLSSAAHQPMIDLSGRYVISFNGEIYNFRELKAQLQAQGYVFSSESDTEVILQSFAAWGIASLARLDGMFAFALYDMLKKELFLVRDRMGVKPLYFSFQGGSFAFASEIKALWTLPWMSKSINHAALYHYLTFLAAPAPLTLYEGVYKLPAGFYMKLNLDMEATFHQWYDVLNASPRVYEGVSDEELADELRVLLDASIKKRMVSDVPVGVFLSGGVDSSLNTAIMARYSSHLKSFNVVFEDQPENDERVWARAIAEKFGTEHHEVVIGRREAEQALEAIIYHQDEPIADWVSIPLYFVSQLARQNGISVVQCGEGADELFCGYSAYARSIDVYHSYWEPLQRYVPQVLRKMLSGCARVMDFHQEHVYNWAHNRDLFWTGAVGFKETAKKTLWQKRALFFEDEIVEKLIPGMNQRRCDSYEYVRYYASKVQGEDFLRKMTYIELKHRLPELLLMRLDKMTMANSLEAREPFLDHKLVEFAFALPLRAKYRDGITKYILKKAAEDIIPHEIIYRKKMGFSAPMARWFRESPLFKNIIKNGIHSIPGINHEQVKKLLQMHQTKDLSPQLWVLANAALTLAQ